MDYLHSSNRHKVRTPVPRLVDVLYKTLQRNITYTSYFCASVVVLRWQGGVLLLGGHYGKFGVLDRLSFVVEVCPTPTTTLPFP